MFSTSEGGVRYSKGGGTEIGDTLLSVFYRTLISLFIFIFVLYSTNSTITPAHRTRQIAWIIGTKTRHKTPVLVIQQGVESLPTQDGTGCKQNLHLHSSEFKPWHRLYLLCCHGFHQTPKQVVPFLLTQLDWQLVSTCWTLPSWEMGLEG